MAGAMLTRRLGPGDERIALDMFVTMARVFEEDGESNQLIPLDEVYARHLLSRTDFFAVVAMDADVVVGGVTAHALPMTRSQETELFIYDLAVVAQKRRLGLGRALITELLSLAAAAGIQTSFVPADDEDVEALEFYRALGGEASPVTFFTFSRAVTKS